MPHCKHFRVPWGDLAVRGNIPRHQSQVTAHQQGGFVPSSPLPAPQSLRIPPPVWGKGRSSSSGSLSLCRSQFGQGWNSWQFQPCLGRGLAAQPLEKSSLWLWERQQLPHSQFLHLVGDFGVLEPREFPSVLSQSSGIAWCLHQPALDGKESGARAAGRSRLGLGSWEEAFPPLCSLPELCEGAAAWQEPQRCPPATATIRDTLPHLWGVPRQPHAGPGVVLALLCMGESYFISSAVPGIPQHWAREQQAQAPCRVSLGITRRKRELHLFPPY